MNTILVALDEKEGVIVCPRQEFDKHEKFLVLTQEEAIALNDYFLKRAGYVSHEFDQTVIDFNKRLDRYVEEIKFHDISKEDIKEIKEK